MKTSYLDCVRLGVQNDFDSTIIAHDFSHLLRVEWNAQCLAGSQHLNMQVIRSAALLHDYHRYLEIGLQRHVPSEEAEPVVREVLAEAGVPNTDADHICRCIVFTERFRCAGDSIDVAKTSKEAMIVRDADMLDALGAIGIARAMMFGAKLGEPLTSNMPRGKAFVPGKSDSIVHHFHEKLLRLESEFLTETGRIEAMKRTRFMRTYLEVLESETASETF